MNVLWLASWYPNKTNPFNGDFIERHAKAVAPFVKSLTIIVAVKDEELGFGCSEVECKTESNITTYIIYYGKSRWGQSIEKIFSGWKYMSLQRRLFKTIVAEKGRPDIVHVHIAMKAGLFAKELKKKYGIPYVVTEQWTGYFKIAQPNIFSMNFLFRRLTESILHNAALLLPVSTYLGEVINADITQVSYVTIPNVVDTSIFFPVNHVENDTLQLVHISVFGYQKNAEAMIEALFIYKSRGGKFVMQVFGPVERHLVDFVKQKNLAKEIIFKGEVTQSELAPALQAADALVLYSRYETFGCVLIEANACGVPVIVSKFPVFDEFITEGLNGVFAEGENPEALATAFDNFYQHRNNFNREKIATETKNKFSFNVVGKTIAAIYEKYVVRN